ncbi:MAG: hypothetical protein M3150_07445 [Pseudomonadota bacterium]|nr:hypothetical protein [Pseudomonadota bacterium]
MRRLELRVPSLDDAIEASLELLAPIEVPPPVDPMLLVDPVLPLLLVEPMLLPVVELEPLVGPLPGVPVSPIGVFCELCWPAPTGALLTAGFGGLPCAMAVPMTAMAATPVSRPLICLNVVMVDSLVELIDPSRLSPALQTLSGAAAENVSPHRSLV